MCLNPKWIYKKGNYKENNYRGMAGDYYELGTYSKCGHCEICIAEKSNNWVIRNFYEAKRKEAKCFITLTYAENPYILIKKDLQNFIKRFRAYLDYNGYKKKIRYFAAGEYGTLNNRPHFHLIIYGWEDKEKEYLTINKKMQIVYQSKIIQDCWGLGRTSIQDFSEHEAPYLALYESSKETFKKAYILTRTKIKTLEELYRRNNKITGKRRKDLENGLKYYREKMEETKNKKYAIREFNTWSLALGWEEFYTEYANQKEYTFTEYIEDKEFVTPSPWVKKLANMGDIKAEEEMIKREKELEQSATEEEEKTKNELRKGNRRKSEIMDWKETKDKIEYL